MLNMRSSDIKGERILHVMQDPVIDNSSYVEDELLVAREHEFYNVLRVLRCFEDMRLGICNKIIGLSYVVHELQRSTFRIVIKDFKPRGIRLVPRNRVLDDILVLTFHKIFVLHGANLLGLLSRVYVLPTMIREPMERGNFD